MVVSLKGKYKLFTLYRTFFLLFYFPGKNETRHGLTSNLLVIKPDSQTRSYNPLIFEKFYIVWAVG